MYSYDNTVRLQKLYTAKASLQSLTYACLSLTSAPFNMRRRPLSSRRYDWLTIIVLFTWSTPSTPVRFTCAAPTPNHSGGLSSKVAPTCPMLLPEISPNRLSDVSRRRTSRLGWQQNQPIRIVGGQKASRTLASYLALLEMRTKDGKTYHCTATIVSKRHLLTAAHCFTDVQSPSNVTAYIGGTVGKNGTRLDISAIHTRYKGHGMNSARLKNPYWYDIAIVRLRTDVPASSSSMSVCTNGSIPVERSIVRVAGYGRTQDLGHKNGTGDNAQRHLHAVDVPISRARACINAYSGPNQFVSVNYSMQVCAAYVRRNGCDTW